MVLISLTRLCAAIPRVTEKKIKARFIDSLRLHVKAGPGGMGQPKYGGLGGIGGSIFAVGCERETLKGLLRKNPSKRISAETGESSHKNKLLGKSGNDLLVKCPVGVTLISEKGEVLGEVNKEGDKVLIARGGSGGSPETSFCGLQGEAHVVTFDLKLIADVGLVGFPNAGKSTLVSILSQAKPKIGSYPFTTIRPTIGVMKYPDLRQISVADLPGLIEGAHINFGMGHKFLKHVERTKLLLVVVDVGGFKLGPKYCSRSCLETIILLNKELELYREDLTERPSMLVINKMDKPGTEEIFHQVQEALKDYKGVLEETPENLRPTRPLEFEKIMKMSAKEGNPEEIEELKESIREILDRRDVIQSLDNQAGLLQRISGAMKEKGPVLI